MSKNYYITTPLYYVNAKPHIGHAYTNILCDAFARYRRFVGEKVFLMTGTDEHGTKIEKTAKDHGKQPKEYVDSIVPEFESLWELLQIRYDYFIRTTDEAHKAVVKNILVDLEQKGEIYKSKYKGWYSVQDETFYTDQQIREGFEKGVGQGLIEIEEENYFFKLSKYQDWLIQYINDNPDFIRPEIRRNEILGFLREPLEDLCITRPRARLSWGIDYPGSDEHVIYVWFDALINYISGIQYSVDDKRFDDHWPADAHVVGKDILRHHAVYWPIMLKAIGVEMPKTILAHGWWTMSGMKVSKSVGNIVDPVELSNKYGIDALRYFVLNEVTLGADGAFSEDLLRDRYTHALANDLGNLWFRFASMLKKYFDGKLPEIDFSSLDQPLWKQTQGMWQGVHDYMKDYDPRRSLECIWGVITRANQFVEEQKPWVLAKDESKRDELAMTLALLGEALAHIGYVIQPFMPVNGEQILKRLQLDPEARFDSAEKFSGPLLKPGIDVERGNPLFPKLEDESAPSAS